MDDERGGWLIGISPVVEDGNWEIGLGVRWFRHERVIVINLLIGALIVEYP